MLLWFLLTALTRLHTKIARLSLSQEAGYARGSTLISHSTPSRGERGLPCAPGRTFTRAPPRLLPADGRRSLLRNRGLLFPFTAHIQLYQYITIHTGRCQSSVFEHSTVLDKILDAGVQCRQRNGRNHDPVDHTHRRLTKKINKRRDIQQQHDGDARHCNSSLNLT